MEDHNRRQFLKDLVILGTAAAVPFINVKAHAANTPARDEWWRVGTRDAFPDDERVLVTQATLVDTGKEARRVRLFVWRKGETVHAMSAFCTHQGHGLSLDKDGSSLYCRRHGSKYGTAGQVTRGPARRGLVFYQTHITTSGELRVNVGKTVPAPASA